MGNACFIAWSELRRLVRQRETLVWTFVMPIVFFYFFSMIQRGGGNADEKEPLALESNGDSGLLGDALEKRLNERGYEVTRSQAVEPTPDSKQGTASRRVTLPADFTARVLRGEQAHVVLASGETGNGANFDTMRVGRAVYSVVADLAALSAEGREVTPEALDELARMPRTLAIDVKPAGERKKIPSGVEQTIPGTLTMFTLIVLLTSGAIGIVIDRNLGRLRRLASTPISRGEIVLGRWLAVLALGLVQVAFGVLVGTLLFHVDWGPDFTVVACVLAAWAAFAASAALLLSSLAGSEGQVVGAGVLAANVLAALGGCWWPIEVTPPWMQKLATFLPTGWVMDALHKLAFFQTGPQGGVRAIVLLTLGALALGWIAARRFRFV